MLKIDLKENNLIETVYRIERATYRMITIYFFFLIDCECCSSSNTLGSAESLVLRSTPPSTVDTLMIPGKDGKDLATPSSTPTTSR